MHVCVAQAPAGKANSLGKAQQNVVCIINGMLRKMKTDEQNTPLTEMLICSICLTTYTSNR